MENKNIQEEVETEELTPEEKTEHVKNLLQTQLEERRIKMQDANEAMSQGKGVLQLETPIRSRSEDVKELAYDFTELTGMEYIDAMDEDSNAINTFKITNRQALALFAKAAAKQTEGVDMRDIQEQIGVTDAVEAVQLATLFFNASTRAGRMRISKKQ